MSHPGQDPPSAMVSAGSTRWNGTHSQMTRSNCLQATLVAMSKGKTAKKHDRVDASSFCDFEVGSASIANGSGDESDNG